MDLTPIKDPVIKAYSYDWTNEILTLVLSETKGGATLRYSKVKGHNFASFLRSSKKGNYYSDILKNNPDRFPEIKDENETTT